MKRKILLPILVLVLSVGMILPMAAPVTASSYSMILNLHASEEEVNKGDTVDIYFYLYNFCASDDLENVSVTVQPIGVTVGSADLLQGDTNNDGILQPTESWKWRISTTVCRTTVYTGKAAATAVPSGMAMNAASSVQVKVTPTHTWWSSFGNWQWGHWGHRWSARVHNWWGHFSSWWRWW